MKWYQGDVNDAVNQVKIEKKNLVLFLADESELSELYSTEIEKNQSVEELIQDSICLKLLQGSIGFQQFSAVYEVTEVPAVFIISFDGKLLKSITGKLTTDEFLIQLSDVIDSTGSKTAEIGVDESVSNSNKVVDVQGESASTEDKVADLQMKLAEKRRKRLEEEKEKEKLEEISRREMGKKLTQLKMTKHEIEEKELKDEIRRQKNDDKLAREKILRQIEEDKMERKEKFQNQVKAPSSADTKMEVRQREHTVDGEQKTRLLFRFPDGSSINNRFDAEETFETVRMYVSHHIQQQFGGSYEFEITQFFPRRMFTSSDDSLTLRVLELIPSATFAVNFLHKKPSNTKGNHQGVAGGAMQLTSTVTSLVMMPVNFLLAVVGFIFQWTQDLWGRRFPGGSQTSSAAATTVVPQQMTEEEIWQERQRRLLAAESRNIKKDGNMAQFSDSKKDKDDEDEARWNGNSTQQM